MSKHNCIRLRENFINQQLNNSLLKFLESITLFGSSFSLKISLIFIYLVLNTGISISNDNQSIVSFLPGNGYFSLARNNVSAPIYISSTDYSGVFKMSELFRKDIEMVTGNMPGISTDIIPESKEIVIIGTIGKSAVIDGLIKSKKLDVSDIENKWETFSIEVIDKPFPGVDKALVIVGSDKRGTIFGLFELSSQIGVSPWYWWADVPVLKRPDIYILPEKFSKGEPAVKYRGIFINDEAPALTGWANEKFGGFNHLFYEKVFELILRMKGNYLWPAMWGKAFYDDDSLSPKLADEFGVVIGTSHHEPMMRAHDEWRRYGSGKWNYDKNPEKLREFWKQGIQRMGNYESLVTVGMRGDGDEPMSEESNIALLEKIVADQRAILKEVTGKDPEQVPQVWALYKEVQDYYDNGMRVPDDVTLLLCDDNWGNIRKLPKFGDTLRAGGYGIYYHFDYVGGPRNYKWLNTNTIPRIWEQMNLAYNYGAKQLWVVNVGDIKPMEFPTQFFLDYAWNPNQWSADNIPGYTIQWATQQFGPEHATDIAEILNKYTKYNSLRKPELLSPETYSLINFREAETILENYKKLAEKAEGISKLLSASYQDAYYQLVLFPVLACSNLNELYFTVARNHLYAKQGRNTTNQLAEKAKELFNLDAELTLYHNTRLAGGKWNHMADQTHIGYTYWQQPEVNAMPKVEEIKIPAEAALGVSVEGSELFWPVSSEISLSEITPFDGRSHYVDVFNRGEGKLNFTFSSPLPWLTFSPGKGEINTEQRVWVKVDWSKAKVGKQSIPITIKSSDGKSMIVQCVVNNPEISKEKPLRGYIESNSYISIEAEHYSNKVETDLIKWQVIPDMGRTLSAIRATPLTIPAQKPEYTCPRLEYKIYLFTSGEIKINTYLSPTLDFMFKGGLNYAVSIDDEIPQIINMNVGYNNMLWEKWVADNINISTSTHSVKNPGEHILKFWLVDPGVVLQKIVIETGEVKPSYLGPPESFFKSE